MPRLLARFVCRSLLSALALGALLLPARSARSSSPFLVVPERSVAEASPAYRYANMTDDEALAELSRRQIPFVRVEVAPGVRAPIRLAGPLHGVTIHSTLPPEDRAKSVFEILDARLALALDDFTAVLENHDIDELVHYTMYRPNIPLSAFPPASKKLDKNEKQDKAGHGPEPGGDKAKKAPKARKTKPKSVKRASRARPAPPGTRHPAGLAIDVGRLHKKDGTWISVREHFHGKIGAKTCGAGARAPKQSTAKELRAIVCESETESIFTYVLTPNYNADHVDHFHMEIKPGVRWFLIH